MNYRASQTVAVKQEEPENVENVIDNVVETSISSNKVAEAPFSNNISDDTIVGFPAVLWFKKCSYQAQNMI